MPLHFVQSPALAFLLAVHCFSILSVAQEPPERWFAPQCEVIPLADHQVSMQIDGIEKLRWNFGDRYPRPFFYPFNGPSGASLTRMGHPGAPNHDHHQSIWFAHNKINGLDYWSNGEKTRIRQKQWYAYADGDAEAVMATLAGWYDADGEEMMEQQMIAALMPMESGEHALELQITFRPSRSGEAVEFGQTNFGFLAVRVAKSLSAHFGGGQLTNSEGQVGEKDIFAKRARWMDYSGPVPVGQGADRASTIEGITYFDHPRNPRFPTYWHVRQDGWMGASFCLDEGFTLTGESPLILRYLLHAHSGGYDHSRAASVHQQFAGRLTFEVSKSTQPHLQFAVRRAGNHRR